MSDVVVVEPTVVTDSGGRRIKLRILDPADTLNLYEACGVNGDNPGYVRYAMVIASVGAIDEWPAPAITSKPILLAVAKKLGNAGLVAVYREMFPPVEQKVDFDSPPAPPVDELLATAKN